MNWIGVQSNKFSKSALNCTQKSRIHINYITATEQNLKNVLTSSLSELTDILHFISLSIRIILVVWRLQEFNPPLLRMCVDHKFVITRGRMPSSGWEERVTELFVITSCQEENELLSKVMFTHKHRSMSVRHHLPNASVTPTHSSTSAQRNKQLVQMEMLIHYVTRPEISEKNQREMCSYNSFPSSTNWSSRMEFT